MGSKESITISCSTKKNTHKILHSVKAVGESFAYKDVFHLISKTILFTLIIALSARKYPVTCTS